MTWLVGRDVCVAALLILEALVFVIYAEARGASLRP